MGRIPGPFERLHASGFNLDRSARREGARNASRWGVGKKVLGARRNPRAPEVDPEFEIEMIGGAHNFSGDYVYQAEAGPRKQVVRP